MFVAHVDEMSHEMSGIQYGKRQVTRRLALYLPEGRDKKRTKNNYKKGDVLEWVVEEGFELPLCTGDPSNPTHCCLLFQNASINKHYNLMFGVVRMVKGSPF